MDHIIDRIEEQDKVKYDETQRQAIKKAVSSKFMVLTGPLEQVKPLPFKVLLRSLRA